MIRPIISKEDHKYEKEFNAWWKELGHKWDKEEDPDGDMQICLMWWAWEAWRTARRFR
jgi:hypothetical protein